MMWDRGQVKGRHQSQQVDERGKYFINRLITPVVVDIDLISRLDDIILEVNESIGAMDKVISRFCHTMARHRNQATCK